MTRDELLTLAKKIRFAEAKTEREMDEDIELFLKNVPDPHTQHVGVICIHFPFNIKF